jgi:hypothetical protein
MTKQLIQVHTETSPAPLSAIESRVAWGPETMSAALAMPRRDAEDAMRALRRHLGMGEGIGAFVTMAHDNAKMATSASAGLTLAPSRELAQTISAMVLAGIYQPSEDDPLTVMVSDAVRHCNCCAWSTPQCIAACVPAKSGRGTFDSCARARAARTLFLWSDVDAAARLWIDAMMTHKRTYGPAARCRFSVSDNIRWDLVAPWAMDTVRTLEMPAYAYTKAAPHDHPAGDTVRLIRSATGEGGRWTAESIVDACHAGETVAMVFTTRKGEDLPTTWHGIPVEDGDESDDRTATPRGWIVGLRAKGPATRYQAGGFVFDPRG